MQGAGYWQRARPSLQNCLTFSQMPRPSPPPHAGALFISYTVKTFGALIFATIMTTRQFLSILLSCFLFLHPLSMGQWWVTCSAGWCGAPCLQPCKPLPLWRTQPCPSAADPSLCLPLGTHAHTRTHTQSHAHTLTHASPTQAGDMHRVWRPVLPGLCQGGQEARGQSWRGAGSRQGGSVARSGGKKEETGKDNASSGRDRL